MRTGLDVVFIKLLSWLTYGEAFVGCPPAYERDARCPVMEWEEQDGFGCACLPSCFCSACQLSPAPASLLRPTWGGSC